VTASVFPADEVTRQFLTAQGRGEAYEPLTADTGAVYDRITKRLHVQRDAAVLEQIKRCCRDVTISGPCGQDMLDVSFSRVVIDLDKLEPLAAAPSSPDNIVAVSAVAGGAVRQVAIGSCTNSSFQDLMLVASVLRGRTVHPNVELAIAPGSRQVLNMLAANGALAELVRAGARILECACGPCIGLGFSPAEGTVSLRTFNRNFPHRSGTGGDQVYLVSVESAVAAALTGQVTDPRLLESLGVPYPSAEAPASFAIDDGMIVPPPSPRQGESVEVIRGSTIVKPSSGQPLADALVAEVLIKVGDKITTDHIMPAGELMKFRSNVPEYAKHVFNCFNEPSSKTFAARALEAQAAGRAGVVVAGDSYGQGSSREHAALCPMYLGVRAVIAKAIERIHQANLVNFGILPLTFADPADYDRIAAGDELRLEGLQRTVEAGESLTVRNVTQGLAFPCRVQLAPRQRKILAGGGLLRYTAQGGQ
jgi:aconitate hydratase